MGVSDTYDAIVIGGGFYGVVIAVYLVKQRGLRKVMLIEQEAALLTRASYHNQARVHNGYHYPRSFTTAYRSRVNLPKFVGDWPQAVKKNFTKLYAISKKNSKITGRQFERFCEQIGAKIQSADSRLRALFEPRLIDHVFLVEEYAFDATELGHWASQALHEHGIFVRLRTKVTGIFCRDTNSLTVTLKDKESKDEAYVSCRYLFNCTYSGLNQFTGDFSLDRSRPALKHEITEMALIKPPSILENLGVTVMDGPFFSMMPFPSRNLHTLSHVRYTPHLHWQDEIDLDPYQKLSYYHCATRVDRMIRDASRYLPFIRESKYIDSLFEVKTILVKNEGDDGRPIFFEKHPKLPGCFSILGGKIDNIYDVLEKLDVEVF